MSNQFGATDSSKLFFNVQGILLDIEGTTSSISFVYDVMFPFVRQHVAMFLDKHWGQDAVSESVEMLFSDAQSVGMDVESIDSPQQACAIVNALMDGDHKTTGLKKLQGQIWQEGFESGELVAHVYDDVVPAIESWYAMGCDIQIYSSGSIQAQKLFFAHTRHGNLLNYFTEHYDTTTGSKKEASSYQEIAAKSGIAPEDFLFISDIPDELAAARQSGFQVVLSCRPENPPIPGDVDYPQIKSFNDIRVAVVKTDSAKPIS